MEVEGEGEEVEDTADHTAVEVTDMGATDIMEVEETGMVTEMVDMTVADMVAVDMAGEAEVAVEITTEERREISEKPWIGVVCLGEVLGEMTCSSLCLVIDGSFIVCVL